MAKTYTAVPSVTAGDVYTASAYNTYTATNVSNLIVPPMVQVKRTTDLTSYSTGSSISWESANFDTDSMWSAGSATRVTATTAGLYNIAFSGYVTGSATITNVIPQVFLNGSSTIWEHYVSGAGVATYAVFACSSTYYLNASDYLSFGVTFIGGSGYTVKGNVSTNNLQTRATVTWIGRTS